MPGTGGSHWGGGARILGTGKWAKGRGILGTGGWGGVVPTQGAGGGGKTSTGVWVTEGLNPGHWEEGTRGRKGGRGERGTGGVGGLGTGDCGGGVLSTGDWWEKKRRNHWGKRK